MPQVTYFAVLPFSRTEDGDFLAEDLAFSKTGDPKLDERGDAIVLGRYGDVPDDLAPYTSE